MINTYDLESLLFDIRDGLKTNLNAEIDRIKIQKNDDVKIKHVDNDAYSVQTLDDKVMNFDPHCLIEAIDIKTEGLGPTSSQQFLVLVLIIAQQDNNLEPARSMFRYGKALKQVIETKWDRMTTIGTKLQIDSIPPQDYVNLNTSKRFKTVGIVISGGIV